MIFFQTVSWSRYASDQKTNPLTEIDIMSKTTRIKMPAIGTIGLAGIFILAGCTGQQHDMEATGAMPEAAGQVTISKDNLNNTIVEISAQNLAALDEKKEFAHYVAWAQFENDSVKLGNLNIAGGNGKLISKTKLKQFEVLITSEEFSSATKPTSEAILRTSSIVLH